MRQWAKGESVNPASREPSHYSTEGRIKKALPQIIDTLVDKALDGDPVAGAVVMDYCPHRMG